MNLRRGNLGVRVGGVALALVVAVSSCAGDSRPDPGAWSAQWDEARALVPSADAFLTDDPTTCDRLLGDFRTVLPALTPTPDEALDDAVAGWVGDAESLAQECPADPVEVEARLTELEILADEIEAGLADLA